MEKFLFEESQFFSQEIATILKSSVIIMPNWKWLALIAAFILSSLLRPIVQFILKEFKKHNPWLKRFPKSFVAYFFRLEIERPLSWTVVTLLLFLLSDILEFKGKFELYYEHILKGFLAFHLIHLSYLAVDSAGSFFAEIVSRSQNKMIDHLIQWVVF